MLICKPTSCIPASRRLLVMAGQAKMTESAEKGLTSKVSAGIIIIGDEILKGQVQDTNSFFLTSNLFSIGIKVQKISVIGDDVDIIANEVREFSRCYTYAITSGGVGPTHDDLTYAGVAKAFNDSLDFHPDLVEICAKYFRTEDRSSPKLKFAYIPKTAVLKFGINKDTGRRNKFPVVQVQNVFILPGVPSLLKAAFGSIEDTIRNPNSTTIVREVFIIQDEVSISDALYALVSHFKENLVVGSYPDFTNRYFKVRLTLQSESENVIDDAVAFLKKALPPDAMLSYDKYPIANAAQKVYELAAGNEAISRKVCDAIAVVEEAFKMYRNDELCIGFNGGKDCTALLHLVFAVFRRMYPNETSGNIRALYIRRGETFPEVEVFIKKCVEAYGLELLTVEGKIKDALEKMKANHPHIMAVLMGSRHSDPNCIHLGKFAPTDPGWPSFMRVSPLIDWSYADIWTFLRLLSLDYCSLYDRGYTSLGSMENTHPNPELCFYDPITATASYRPAYELQEIDSERSGRKDCKSLSSSPPLKK